MNLLALDTSTELCSVALRVGDAVRERTALVPRHHAEHVLPMVDDLLTEAGLARNELDGIAVGRGPGAFTGVRLAVSVAQGLALGLNLPTVTVSSLAALAMDAPDNGNPILAVIDARMGEIYAGAFRHTAQGGLAPLNEECVCKPDALEVPTSRTWNVVGTGWGTYAEVIRARLPATPIWAEGEHYPQARHVAHLALAQFAAGHTLAPEETLPVYLRNKVALTLRERGKPVPH